MLSPFRAQAHRRHRLDKPAEPWRSDAHKGQRIAPGRVALEGRNSRIYIPEDMQPDYDMWFPSMSIRATRPTVIYNHFD